MKIFLTGISGLLGGHVARLCLHKGHQVIALVRCNGQEKFRKDPSLTVCQGDLSNEDLLVHHLRDSEVVIHCAADTGVSAKPNPNQEMANITGVRHMMNAAKRNNIRKFIHVSSASTIASGYTAAPGTESLKLAPAKTRLPYTNTKIEGENILLDEFRKTGFPVTIINPTYILAPGDFRPSSGKLVLAVLTGQLPFYGSGGKSIVDARDVAQTIINAISMGRNGHNYLVSGGNLSYHELVSLICRAVNTRPQGIRLPHFVGDIICAGFSLAEYFNFYGTLNNSKTIRIAFESHYYSAEKAKLELCFAPRPLEETIIDTARWFKNEYQPLEERRWDPEVSSQSTDMNLQHMQ